MIKLLSSLKKLPAENCFILTYNLDLPFFEAALFEPLYGAGCRNTVVLCDPQQYNEALQDSTLLRYAGLRYLLFSGLTSPRGAFHPKLILLTNKTAGRLFLTSGNLSRAGYTTNWEVVTDFEFNHRRPDPVAWKAFRWAYLLFEKLTGVSEHSNLVRERLERLWGTTPWLREELPFDENAPVWMLHNLEETLLGQIIDLYRQNDGTQVKEIGVVSPFFDTRALALSEILKQLDPASIQIYTQTAQGIQKELIDRVLQGRSNHVKFFSLGTMSRRLHAKTLLIKTKQGVWLSSGSANFSAPALLHPARQGNTEMVVLRYETDPTYYDEWMAELTQTAIPLPLNSLPSEVQDYSFPSLSNVLNLHAAQLRNKQLELHLTLDLPDNCSIRVLLQDEQLTNFEFSNWKKTSSGWISLRCSNDFIKRAEFPVLISVEIIQSGETLLRSRPVILHNLAALEKFSKPPRQVNRPSIPEGLITENEEQCAQILEMIYGLLITNQDDLARHNPRIVAERQREQEEEEIPEEYDPDEHIVAEPVRRPTGGSANSDDLYINYDERLTYQEILNAVLSVAYHPRAADQTEPIGSSTNIPLEDSDNVFVATILLPLTTEEAEAKVRARIASGFQRLVENFQRGLADSEYLETVSPAYLLELWTIISSYLRVVYRNEMLSDDRFQELSLSLLYSFWGEPTQPGAWQFINARSNDAEKQAEFTRLLIPLNLWLHIKVLRESLASKRDRRRFDLAGFIRMLLKDGFSPRVISEYPEGTYKRLFQSSFPRQFEYLPAANVVEDLLHFSQRYDDASLKDEIKAQSGYAPTIDLGNISDLSQVPRLFISLPLSDQTLDMCWNIFRLFMFQPRLKPIAWARFENTNPAVDENDMCKLTVFYRNDDQILLFSVERANRIRHPNFDPGHVSIETVVRTENVAEIEKLHMLSELR